MKKKPNIADLCKDIKVYMVDIETTFRKCLPREDDLESFEWMWGNHKEDTKFDGEFYKYDHKVDSPSYYASNPEKLGGYLKRFFPDRKVSEIVKDLKCVTFSEVGVINDVETESTIVWLNKTDEDVKGIIRQFATKQIIELRDIKSDTFKSEVSEALTYFTPEELIEMVRSVVIEEVSNA